MTAPSDARRSFVRTNAPPLPGLTCWNSTTLKTVPSTSMWLPFLNWFVEIMRCPGYPPRAAARAARVAPAALQTRPWRLVVVHERPGAHQRQLERRDRRLEHGDAVVALVLPFHEGVAVLVEMQVAPRLDVLVRVDPAPV